MVVNEHVFGILVPNPVAQAAFFQFDGVWLYTGLLAIRLVSLFGGRGHVAKQITSISCGPADPVYIGRTAAVSCSTDPSMSLQPYASHGSDIWGCLVRLGRDLSWLRRAHCRLFMVPVLAL